MEGLERVLGSPLDTSTQFLRGGRVCRRPTTAEISSDFPALKQEPVLEPRAPWTWNREQLESKKTLLKSIVGVTGVEPATPTSDDSMERRRLAVRRRIHAILLRRSFR